MKTMEIEKRIKAARDGTPTFVFKNANVVNVFSEEIVRCDVALYENTIIGLGQYDCDNTYDCNGAYLCPGFIDSHVHIESSMVCPPEFARIVLPFGTTAAIADPHEIANVCGMDGIRFLHHSSKEIGLHVYYMFPSSVPCAEFEENAVTLTNEDAAALCFEKTVHGLGEVMDWVSVLNCRENMMKKLAMFRGSYIDGHAPGLAGNNLAAYLVAGPATDHEAYTYEEIMEKLSAGMRIQLRVGSAANNMREVLHRLAKENVPLDRFMLCTDDKHTENILAEGHINHIARIAVEAGIPAPRAVRMASHNAAVAYGLSTKGAIAPGYDGDLVLFENLTDFRPLDVFVMGRNIKELPIHPAQVPDALCHTVNPAPVMQESLVLRVGVDKTAPVIEMEMGQLATKLTYEPVPQKNGLFTADATYAKLAVIERHHATGHIGLGIVKNFGLHEGAIASTVAHDSHNIVVMGTNDADMLACVDALKTQGGGYVLVIGGKTAAAIPLPVGGLLGCEPYETLVAQQEQFLRALHSAGVPTESDPLIRLSFFCLPVIPEARVTTQGVYDVVNGRFL